MITAGITLIYPECNQGENLIKHSCLIFYFQMFFIVIIFNAIYSASFKLQAGGNLRAANEPAV